ncbi:MAG: hypothetical protein M1814_001524 [Vezdaea aestivalis]|nr:MAG: hypothetical protein M1814_001524 [Vezdaea aestivalis]
MATLTTNKQNGKVVDGRAAKIKTKSGDIIAHPGGKARHGQAKSILRLVLCVLYFAINSAVILCTQICVSPLYFIDRGLYYAAIALTKRMFGVVVTTVTQWWAPTLVRVSGDAGVQPQLSRRGDGTLETRFPERIVLIANHQLYTEWLYLWWVAYTSQMHGHLYIILKDTLRLLPLLGQGMMFYDFIFLSRKWAVDETRLIRAMKHLTTLSPSRFFPSKVLDPMWLLIFPEGTTLSRNGRNKSQAWAKKQGINDMKHLLLPRSTGLHLCLQGLRGSVDWVYDCTVAYEGIPEGQFGEEIFSIWSTYFQGRPPKSVNMYWRRFAVASIPLDTAEQFADWLQARWDEKDELLEQFRLTGRFPANSSHVLGSTGTKSTTNSPYIDTEVRLGHWIEVAQIFTPLLSVGVIVGLIKRLKTFFLYR